ncbi:hypothetical protein TURU_070403 [Turdus rufiventris]|nr:hypothetical protein TURU_070403 [Turdus rufiventris]
MNFLIMWTPRNWKLRSEKEQVDIVVFCCVSNIGLVKYTFISMDQDKVHMDKIVLYYCGKQNDNRDVDEESDICTLNYLLPKLVPIQQTCCNDLCQIVIISSDAVVLQPCAKALVISGKLSRSQPSMAYLKRIDFSS